MWRNSAKDLGASRPSRSRGLPTALRLPAARVSVRTRIEMMRCRPVGQGPFFRTEIWALHIALEALEMYKAAGESSVWPSASRSSSLAWVPGPAFISSSPPILASWQRPLPAQEGPGASQIPPRLSNLTRRLISSKNKPDASHPVCLLNQQVVFLLSFLYVACQAASGNN